MDVNYVGSFSGAMAQSPSDSSPSEMLPGDLETARVFGKRVAEVAARFKVTPELVMNKQELLMEVEH